MSERPGENLAKGAEIAKRSKETRELIQELLGKPEYARFEGNREDVRILQEIIHLQKQKNPDNPAGLSLDNPNLAWLAQQKMEAGKSEKAQARVRAKLEGLKNNALDRKRRNNLKADVFKFDTKTKVSDARKKLNEVIANKTSDKRKLDTPEAKMTKGMAELKQVMAALQGKQSPKVVASLIQKLEASDGIMVNLSKALSEAKDNYRRGSRVVEVIKSSDSNEHQNALHYLNQIKNGLIPHLENHLDFAKQAYVYLNAQSQGFETGDFKEKVDQNRKGVEAKKLAYKPSDTTAEMEAVKAMNNVLKDSLSSLTFATTSKFNTPEYQELLSVANGNRVGILDLQHRIDYATKTATQLKADVAISQELIAKAKEVQAKVSNPKLDTYVKALEARHTQIEKHYKAAEKAKGIMEKFKSFSVEAVGLAPGLSIVPFAETKKYLDNTYPLPPKTKRATGKFKFITDGALSHEYNELINEIDAEKNDQLPNTILEKYEYIKNGSAKLEVDLATAKRNAKKIRATVKSLKGSEKADTEAYLEFIENVQIPEIEKHVKFAKAATEYLKKVTEQLSIADYEIAKELYSRYLSTEPYEFKGTGTNTAIGALKRHGAKVSELKFITNKKEIGSPNYARFIELAKGNGAADPKEIPALIAFANTTTKKLEADLKSAQNNADIDTSKMKLGPLEKTVITTYQNEAVGPLIEDITEHLGAVKNARNYFETLKKAAPANLKPADLELNAGPGAKAIEAQLKQNLTLTLAPVDTSELERKEYRNYLNTIALSNLSPAQIKELDAYIAKTLPKLENQFQNALSNAENGKQALPKLPTGSKIEKEIKKNAEAYVAWNQEIAKTLQKHVDLAKATQDYLTKFDPSISSSIEALKLKLKAEKAKEKSAFESGKEELATLAIAKQAAIEAQIELLDERQKGVSENLLQEYKAIIEQGNENPSDNLRLAMDMYIELDKALAEKNPPHLPNDKASRAFLMAAAMMAGPDKVEALNKVKGIHKLGPEFVFHEQKQPYFFRPLLDNPYYKKNDPDLFSDPAEKTAFEKTWKRGPRVLKAEFLLPNGLPNPEHLMDFEREAHEADLVELHNSIIADITNLIPKYRSYASSDKEKAQEALLKVIANTKELYGKYEKYTQLPSVKRGQSELGILESEIRTLESISWFPDFESEANNTEMEKQAQELERVRRRLNSTSLGFVSMSDTTLEQTLIYKMLEKNGDLSTLDALRNKGNFGQGEMASQIVLDLQNNFVTKRNNLRLQTLSTSMGIDPAQLKEVRKNVEISSIEGLSDLRKLCEVHKINYEGAWLSYYKAGHWSKADKKVDIWEEDLEKMLKAGNGKESQAYLILQDVLKNSDGKADFLEAISNDKNSGHEDARVLLREIIKEFKFRTDQHNIDLASDINYRMGIEQGVDTVTARVNKVGRYMFDKIFGSGTPIGERAAHAVLAYIVLSQFRKKNTWIGKGLRGVAFGITASMVYEGVTNKSALSMLGIDTPSEVSRGSWLNEQANSSGIETNDESGYRALDIIKGKRVEDLLKWYEDREKYAWTEEDQGKNRGPSIYQSLVRSGLLKKRELNSIMPDETNKEKIGQKFLAVFEGLLVMHGKRVEGHTENDREKLIQAGYEDLHLHFTAEGWQKLGQSDQMLYMSPAESKRYFKEKAFSHKWTYYEMTLAVTEAQRWKNSYEERAGITGVPHYLYETMSEYYTKALPSWLRFKGKAKHLTEEMIHDFYEDYGPTAWEAMMDWGKKGYEFSLEKGGEIKVWWQKDEVPLRLQRTAKNTWMAFKTGVKIPGIAALEAGDYATTSLVEYLNNADKALKEWSRNEYTGMQLDIFPDETTGSFTVAPAKAKELAEARKSNLNLNMIANGYEIFGKYETDWFDIDAKNEGLLERKDLFTDPMKRFQFKVEEGYVNFMGFSPEIHEPISSARNDAYRDGVKYLVEFLKEADNFKNLNLDDEFTKAIQKGDPDSPEVRAFIEPYIQHYGSWYSHQNGYMLFMRVPVPLHKEHQNAKKFTGQKTAKTPSGKSYTVGGRTVTKHNTEYYERKNGDWKYGNLDKFKKSIVFSIDDDIMGNYIENVSADDTEVNKYMKTFLLWEPAEVSYVINSTQAAIEGAAFTDYAEGNNLRERFFTTLKHDFHTEFMEQHHWSRSPSTMKNSIDRYFPVLVGEAFVENHVRVAERVKNRSPYKTARQHFDEDHIEHGYRIYMAEKLTAAYRAKYKTGAESKTSIPKNEKGKDLPESKWVEHFTDKFVEKSVSLPEAVIMGVGGGVYTLADAIIRGTYNKILNEAEQAGKK